MKMLKHFKTGVLFPYNEDLLRLNRNMQVVDHYDDSSFENEPVSAGIIINSKPIKSATKDELKEHLINNFGIEAKEPIKRQELIDKIIELTADEH